ncbi:MAG: transporter substrate-binding domain-containing protein [Chitinispirillales bacterium]|jgi:polar amino acid transport system substrate-binding protein|nr:transporter substrate-binding domain-containing protein [Chitinispirillales bacterium]
MNRRACAVAVAAITAIAMLLLPGCGDGDSDPTDGGGENGKGEVSLFRTLADFEGAKIADITGSSHPRVMADTMPIFFSTFFGTVQEQVDALKSGVVDAMSSDLPIAMYTVLKNPDLVIFPVIPVIPDRYGFAVTKGSDLGIYGNDKLNALREDGTLEELEDIWFSTDASRKVLPVLTHKGDSFNGNAGTIRYGFFDAIAPMSYVCPDKGPLGYEIDVATRIAYELNMEIEFIPMEFPDLLTALIRNQTVDMVGGTMSITPERMASVDFVGPNYEGGIVLVIKKDRLGI